MSIDAVIEDVQQNPDGTATLLLRARDPNGTAGQSRMTVENPPENFESCIGTEIWGGDNCLMVGRQTRWADRIGYTRLRLVQRGK